MSVNANFGLLSSTGTQALQAYMQNNTYMNSLAGVSLKNDYTNSYCGFNFQSIFGNSSGICGSGASLYGSGYPQQTAGGVSSLPYGPIGNYTTNSSLTQSSNPYDNGAYGTSLVDNFYNSIGSVALGQQAPTSVFEQRLAYHFGFANGFPQGGTLYGDYSNFFNVDSSTIAQSANTNSSAQTQTGSYNVFNAGTSEALTLGSVSSMMSKLNVMS